MKISPRPRGRPPGTGIDDRERLTAIAAMLLADPQLKPTTAIKRVMQTDESSLIRRLQRKWKAAAPTLMTQIKALGQQQTQAAQRRLVDLRHRRDLASVFDRAYSHLGLGQFDGPRAATKLELDLGKASRHFHDAVMGRGSYADREIREMRVTALERSARGAAAGADKTIAAALGFGAASSFYFEALGLGTGRLHLAAQRRDMDVMMRRALGLS